MTLQTTPIASEQATKALQALALAGVRHWLEQPQLGPGPSQEARADLAAVLVTAQTGLVPHRRAFVDGLVRLWLVNEPPTLSLTQARWVSDAHQPTRLALIFQTIGGWIARLRGKPAQVAFAPLAPMLQAAIASNAFKDPAFRRRVAESFRAHLCTKVILHPETGASPGLSAPVLWAAAAKGAADIPEATALEESLKARAAALASTGGWAGFWDVYILSRKSAEGRSPAATRLPLGTTEAEGAEARQYREGWRDDLPGYAAQLVAGRA
jgi:hypothetical protein